MRFSQACQSRVFPPTFNGRLDFSVLPLNVIHHFVLLLLSLLELLLLPLLSVSLFCFFLAGVLCGSKRVKISGDARVPSHAALTE